MVARFRPQICAHGQAALDYALGPGVYPFELIGLTCDAPLYDQHGADLLPH